MRERNFLATVSVISLLAFSMGARAATPLYPSQGTKRGQPVALRHQGLARQIKDAYTGRIANKRGFCVLINPNSETTYQLDDQHKAKRFLGKDVIVIGTRDIIKNTIHVSEIRFNKSS